jgi:6-phosphogluconolactonase (cycloisomerase 2 family)
MIRMSRTLLILTLAFASVPVLSHAQDDRSSGAVFVMTNAASKNEIIAYKRQADGSLTESRTFATGGRGSGGVTDPLGSQGSLTLTQDRSLLLAVNAGSGEISVFRVYGDELSLVAKTPCGGAEPVAVAQHGDLVYVVNAGGASNVTGFRLHRSGNLDQIPNSTAFLTTGNSGASSLSFSPDGQTLLVTEKLTGNIDAFHVQTDGTLGPIAANPSAGPGLFGVLFAPNGTALATETGPSGGHNASAISSYAVQANGTLSPISTSVPTLAAATCWHVVTPEGKFVYTSNAGSGTISGFSIAANGALTPISATVVATLPAGSATLDIAVTADGKFLYTLDSGTGTVGIFAINADGTLNPLPEAAVLSAASGFNGIAAI